MPRKPKPRAIKCADGSNIAFFWLESSIVKHLHKVKPTAWVIYMVICSFARNSTQQAWPSIAKMAEMTGYSQTTVRAAVDELKKSKLISVTQVGKIGREHNLYTLLPVRRAKSVKIAKTKDVPPQNLRGPSQNLWGPPTNFVP